jgi:hypothetical protein
VYLLSYATYILAVFGELKDCRVAMIVKIRFQEGMFPVNETDMHRAKSPNGTKQSDTIYTNYPPPSSTPPTLTVIFTGNGDIPLAFVINGTAVRPRSDEV